MKYLIKQVIVTEPKVELPEGSRVVSVKHHDEYESPTDSCMRLPEMWQVIYLEPEEA